MAKGSGAERGGQPRVEGGPAPESHGPVPTAPTSAHRPEVGAVYRVRVAGEGGDELREVVFASPEVVVSIACDGPVATRVVPTEVWLETVLGRWLQPDPEGDPASAHGGLTRV
jgi:hypothetical protein